MQVEIYPLEIKLDRSKKKLFILFSNKKKYSITSELLRIESPSAEVQGHGGPKVFVINKQSFGWTLEFGLPGSGLSLLSAGIIIASVATCFSVGYWSSTLKADQKE